MGGLPDNALWDSVFICKGLPYYAHLIGLHASQAACEGKSVVIKSGEIKTAQEKAISESNSSIRTNFDDAVHSERNNNIFLPVLVACALAKKDASGRFLAKDVAVVLSDITGKEYGVPAFSYHLDQFATYERGRLLEKLGSLRQFRFRFSEALSEPYVIMKAKESGLITKEIEAKYGPTRQEDLFSI